MFILLLFFYCNFRKFCALFIEFLFPHDIFPEERSYHTALSPQPHLQNQKNPLKTSLHFPVTIITCKHWSKFVTCSPSPRDCGGVSHSQRHRYYGFWLCRTKWLSKNFDLLTLEKKWAWEGALGAFQFFGHLKRALELFISIRMIPLAAF